MLKLGLLVEGTITDFCLTKITSSFQVLKTIDDTERYL